MRAERIGILVLGTENTTCTVLERSWNRTLRTVDTFPVGVEHKGGGPVPDMESLGAGLKRNGCERVIVGLPLSMAIVERIDLPAMKKTDLEQALPFELERHLPLPLAEFAWSYGRVPGPRDTARCLVAAVRKPWVDGLVERFSQVGLRLLGLRFSLVEQGKMLAADMGTGLIASPGPRDVEWAEIREGSMLGARSTPVQARQNILATIERGLVPAPGDAGPGRVGLLGPDGEELAPRVRELAGWEAFSMAADPALAIGRGHFRRRQPDIVLAGVSIDDSAVFHRNLTAALLVVAVVLSFLSGRERIWKQQETLKTMKEEIAELKKGLRKGKGGGDGSSIVSSLKVLREFAAIRNAPIGALGELARKLPDQAWLHSFDMNEKGKIEISGFAEDSAALVESLADSPQFSGVQWEGTVIRDGSGRFKVRMNWKGGAP